MKTEIKIKFLAYYLPQYHPIPENDLWWGKGFTEWTNVTKAKPLFKGHYQPILPADLGFYDLRIPEIQVEQSELAQKYGVDGFIYYQYWFGNDKMLLEKPAEAMLKNPKITIPFCFCWANETWKGIWHGLDNPAILIEQTYQGEIGYQKYFDYLLPFFKDKRYIKVNNMPMFHVYKIEDIPDLELFTETFNNLAKSNNFSGIYFIATHANYNITAKNNLIYGHIGLNIFNEMRYEQSFQFRSNQIIGKIERKLCKIFKFSTVKRNPFVLDYELAVNKLQTKVLNEKYIPCVVPNWDNSARSGKKSMVFKNANPDNWKQHLSSTVENFKKYKNNPNFIVIKSWNEWAEGNYLEPDIKFGRKWLEAILEVKKKI